MGAKITVELFGKLIGTADTFDHVNATGVTFLNFVPTPELAGHFPKFEGPMKLDVDPWKNLIKSHGDGTSQNVHARFALQV